MKNITRHLTEKTSKIMALVLLLTFPFITISCDNDDDETSMPEPTMNIVEIADSTPELSTLTAAIVEAGLVDALSGETPYTVFAPTNAAFAELDPATLNTIISTPSLLSSLLQYHVVSGTVMSSDLTTGPVPTLLSGQSIDVAFAAGSVVLNESSNVVAVDIAATNGVIHIIDEVLIPEDFVTVTLAQIVAGSGDHTTLLSALTKPDLAPLLAAASDPTADLTVFAPTNAAFAAVLAALGKTSIDEIPVNLLYEIVSYHILGTAVTSDQLSNGDVPTILAGIPGGPDFETVAVDISDGVKINSAMVTAPDLKALNGVAHVVDAVLLPSYVTYSLGTIAETVIFENDFTILAAALRKAELLETIATTANLTVFAPDNAGFIAANITSLDGLEKADLTPILTYHVLDFIVKAADLPENGIAPTLNGENIYLGYLNNQRVLINGLTEIKAVDIEKSNGVIHVIDRTLTPPAPNVVEIALAFADMGDDSEFTVLTSYLASPEYADVTQALIDATNVTVFAPTDDAFAEIADVILTLTEDQIRTVLTYHAAGGRVLSGDLVDQQHIPMLNMETVKVNKSGEGAVTLTDKSMGADANVVEVNVHGSNGVIHVIDKVLLPTL